MPSSTFAAIGKCQGRSCCWCWPWRWSGWSFSFPLIWLIMMSLKTEVDMFAVPPLFIFSPTLENYQATFADRDFRKAATQQPDRDRGLGRGLAGPGRTGRVQPGALSLPLQRGVGAGPDHRAHDSADRLRGAALPALQSPRPAEHSPGADPGLHRLQSALRRLDAAQLLRGSPGRSGAGGHDRRRDPLARLLDRHLPLAAAGIRRDGGLRRHRRLERVPLRPDPDRPRHQRPCPCTWPRSSPTAPSTGVVWPPPACW